MHKSAKRFLNAALGKEARILPLIKWCTPETFTAIPLRTGGVSKIQRIFDGVVLG